MCETDNVVGAVLCGSSHAIRWGWVFKFPTYFLAPHFEINAPCLNLPPQQCILEFHWVLFINLDICYSFLHLLFSAMDQAL